MLRFLEFFAYILPPFFHFLFFNLSIFHFFSLYHSVFFFFYHILFLFTWPVRCCYDNCRDITPSHFHYHYKLPSFVLVFFLFCFVLFLHSSYFFLLFLCLFLFWDFLPFSASAILAKLQCQKLELQAWYPFNIFIFYSTLSFYLSICLSTCLSLALSFSLTLKNIFDSCLTLTINRIGFPYTWCPQVTFWSLSRLRIRWKWASKGIIIISIIKLHWVFCLSLSPSILIIHHSCQAF